MRHIKLSLTDIRFIYSGGKHNSRYAELAFYWPSLLFNSSASTHYSISLDEQPNIALNLSTKLIITAIDEDNWWYICVKLFGWGFSWSYQGDAHFNELDGL